MSPATFTDGCESGIHPHESECNLYYQCDHGHRFPDQECPEGLLFNSELLVCDWPANVVCPEVPDESPGRPDGKAKCYKDCMENNKPWNWHKCILKVSYLNLLKISTN